MSILRPDRPIRTSRTDLLDRGPLVTAIAEQILHAPKRNTATSIALNAPWGAGKSSFLNLLEEALDSPADTGTSAATQSTRPIVIRFNPWLFGTIEQLIQMFFADLARAIDATSPSTKNENPSYYSKLAGLLDDYGHFIAAASTFFANGPATLASLLVTTTKAAGLSFSSTSKKERKPSLSQQKDAINRQFKKLPHRIVVFIDDVDRLEPDLTALFFRMVRLSANFTNVVYVLAFDRAVVESHLAHDSPAFGREYLEKIIQVSYNIPSPHPTIIPSILRCELASTRRSIEESVMDGTRYERLFNDRRYNKVFDAGFSQHFSTVRSIKRYVNGLCLTLPPVAGDVDIVDFYVIELVRLFYPDIYVAINQNKDMLLRFRSQDVERTDWLGSLRHSSIPPHLYPSLCSLLRILFPGLAAQRLNDQDEEAIRLRWQHDKRVCSDAAFDRFFSLSGALTKTAKAEYLIENVVNNVEEIQDVIEHARKTGGIAELLGAIQDQDLSPAQASAVAMAICKSDPRDDLQLRDEQDSYELLGCVVKHCMTCYGAGNELAFLTDLIASMECGGSLFVGSKIIEEVSNLDSLVGQYADQVRDEVTEKIIRCAESDQFWDGTRWYYLIGVARRLGGENNVLRLVESRVMANRTPQSGVVWHDDRLLRFCEMFPEAVSADRERFENGTREEHIDGWLPVGARDRVVKLASSSADDNAIRAKAVIRQLWPDHQEDEETLA